MKGGPFSSRPSTKTSHHSTHPAARLAHALPGARGAIPPARASFGLVDGSGPSPPPPAAPDARPAHALPGVVPVPQRPEACPRRPGGVRAHGEPSTTRKDARHGPRGCAGAGRPDLNANVCPASVVLRRLRPRLFRSYAGRVELLLPSLAVALWFLAAASASRRWPELWNGLANRHWLELKA